MEELLAARVQMAASLGFHIVFAAIGMAMPFLMAAAHYRWLKTRDPAWFALTKAWSRGVAIFFAIGAVSGTALSFELGLLWPEFMRHAGAVIGMPFSLEGAAFFVEAVALGLFLYGWDRMPPWAHWTAGLVVGISGVASAYFVVCANAWMNSPAGFTVVPGAPGAPLQFTDIDPVAAMFNERSFDMGVHMILAAFVATSAAVAGVHAMLLLRRPTSVIHRNAMKLSLLFLAVSAILQPLSGDLTAKATARTQPLKLAAMEAHFHTERGAGLLVGGIPDLEARTVSYGFEIPKALSFLAYGDFDAEVKGLDAFPRDEWPPVLIAHIAFQIMVGLGTALAALGALTLYFRFRRPRALDHPRFVRLVSLATPLGFIALEAGWVVTELGRQPWIIYGVMKTRDAVTSMPGIGVTAVLFIGLYGFLAVVAGWLLRRQIRVLEAEETGGRP
jgi:cytochrome d ubiquinol oxidase subunit I